MSRWKAVKRLIKIVLCDTNEGGFSVAPSQEKK